MSKARFRRGAVVAAAICLTLLATSCGNRRKPVFRVHGQILDAKGKPAAGAVVIFHPVNADANEPLKPVGKVDENGRFSLTTYTESDGAQAGDYVITIIWRTPKKSPFESLGSDQLQGRYATPEKSPHRFTVENKPDNEVPTLRLE